MKATRRAILWVSIAACAGAGGLIVQRSLAQTASKKATSLRTRLWEAKARESERQSGRRGRITGRVLFADGHPAAGFQVFARFHRHQHGEFGEGSTITDADGYYQIAGLKADEFRVEVSNGDKPYLPDSVQRINLRTLAGNCAADVNFTLYQAPQITVRVRDAQTGLPVADLPLEVSPVPGVRGNCKTYTDLNGSFRFRPTGPNAQVSLGHETKAGSFADPAPGYESSRSFRFDDVTHLEDVVWDVKTYSRDPKMFYDTVFRGLVSDPDGKPVGGATVRMVRDGSVASTTTNRSGQFSFKAQRIRSDEYGDRGGLPRKGILIEATKGDLTGIHYATPEETWSAIPVRIGKSEGASVHGQVVDPQGRPLAGVPFCYSEVFHAGSAHREKEGGKTDASGAFSVSGLSPEAHYRFTFGRNAYSGNPTGFGVTVAPDVGYTLGWLRLQTGERHDLGRVTVWKADGTVTGRVIRPGGKLPKLLMVVVEGKHCRTSTSLDAEGRFHAEALVDEPLMLYVYESKDGDGFYRTSPGSQDEVGRATVRAGDKDVQVTIK